MPHDPSPPAPPPASAESGEEPREPADDAPPEGLALTLITRARGGDGAALDELLRLFRPQLHRVAQRRIGRRLLARVDASDVVQQTLLEAHRDIGAFHGGGRAELIAWLQCILQRNLASAVRTHLVVQRRAVGRELALDDSHGGGGALRLRLMLDQTSPSQRLLRNEKMLRLVHAMLQLPEDQRQAVRLRHFEGHTLEEIAQKLGRTPMAAASLIKRGVLTLRKRLGSADGPEDKDEPA